MTVVKRIVLLEYSAEQMYGLVAQIENYPAFLPGCSDVDVQRHDQKDEVVATLTMNFHGLKYSFTTRNQNVAGKSITMRLVDGPFKTLTGDWIFTPLRADGCKVEFELEYAFSNPVLAKVIGPAFGKIANSFVDSFCKRAEEIYG